MSSKNKKRHMKDYIRKLEARIVDLKRKLEEKECGTNSTAKGS